MKPFLIVACFAMVLCPAIYLLRRNTLRDLNSRAAALRQAKEAPTAVVYPEQKRPFDSRKILAALRPPEIDRATAASLSEEIKRLPDADLEQLLAAAKAEAATAPRLLIGVAAYAFVAPETHRKVPENLAPALADLRLHDYGADYILRHIANLWTDQNPGAAARWMREALASGRLDASSDKEFFTALARLAAVRAAPVQELENIRAQPRSRQDGLLSAGAEFLHSAEDARAFTAAVVAWPNASASGAPLEAAMTKLLEFSGFPAASAWLDALPEVTAPQKEAARIALTLSNISAADMPARADWVVFRADAAVQAGVAASLIEQWITKDHNAAGVWLNSHRSDSWYDAAAAAFATGVAGKEPASAFDWALTLSDGAARRSAIKSVMTKWRSDNAAAALDYLEKSALPADWKAEFTADK